MTGHGRSRKCYRDKSARPPCPYCGTPAPCEDCRRTNREQRAKERATEEGRERAARIRARSDRLTRAPRLARYAELRAALRARQESDRAEASE